MEWVEIAYGALGGGCVTTIVTTIISKVRNKGERTADNDEHLKTLSEIMSETIKNVQEINKETIANLKAELQQSQELIKLSHAREDNLIELINKGREYQDALIAKNKHKNKIIHKAHNCNLLKGKPLEDCVVLNAYEEYTDCKTTCKLNDQQNRENDGR